jgi:hypothetical protein
MNEPRMQPVLISGRCVGHVVRSARGAVAYGAKDTQLGTYATAEQAIDAITKRTAETGKGD